MQMTAPGSPLAKRNRTTQTKLRGIITRYLERSSGERPTADYPPTAQHLAPPAGKRLRTPTRVVNQFRLATRTEVWENLSRMMPTLGF